MTKKEVTDLSYRIVGCAINVHNELGPGLLESVYERCLIHELNLNGFYTQSQIRVPIDYKGIDIEADLRLDILVDETVVVEVKAVETLHPIYKAQLLSYMKLLKKPQGLLINFHSETIKQGTVPLVNEYFKLLPS